ncbi:MULTISPECIES: GlxA family transcriptional regulator [unclassified Crossiella]|uniref:GlxA family transcriptional regulator n=1 Tax=unclassified Crossiella TaxID=2620835 RepID=UPI001FFE7382|nr:MULTISPECIES: DJ-1/PfpI family protein [unclassified Crossiella]MCK2243241.1 DJ-1/PfpI family protein [Crossiella sp. S99.2]MCK2254290.1 DJ-1/PfpI family protein [Crossiella sp. S99.1]
MATGPRRVVIIGYDQAELLDIACPSDVLDAANRLGATPGYEIRLASMGGRAVRCASGLTLAAQVKLEQVAGPVDTMIVVGGWTYLEQAGDQRFVDQVRRVARLSRRVASVCVGSTLLAAAGLLDGRRATTHWFYADKMAEHYPAVTVDPAPLFIKDGSVYTSAGVTSGLDLTLALVEEDHGAVLARAVARNLVTYLQRPGNQAQVSVYVAAPPPEHAVVRELMNLIEADLAADLRAGTLARRAGLSTRHLARLFEQQLGSTPGRYVRTARTRAAARLLESTRLPLTAVAARCGFSSTETLRQAFLDLFQTSPSVYRMVHRRRAAAS